MNDLGILWYIAFWICRGLSAFVWKRKTKEYEWFGRPLVYYLFNMQRLISLCVEKEERAIWMIRPSCGIFWICRASSAFVWERKTRQYEWIGHPVVYYLLNMQRLINLFVKKLEQAIWIIYASCGIYYLLNMHVSRVFRWLINSDDIDGLGIL